ncbi:hypothetical protein ACI8AC_24105 [Geodermatophilus sp. SYSU D00758]
MGVLERIDHHRGIFGAHWLTCLRLYWAARSDRRAGLPLGLSAATTPILAELVAEYGEVCELERSRYQSTAGPLAVRLEVLDAELVALEAMLAWQAEEADRLAEDPGEEWLSVRYPGEEELGVTRIRARRMATHRRAAEAAQVAHRETEERRDAVRAEQASLVAERRKLADELRFRVTRAHETTHRLGAVYRKALARRHPEREKLVTTWDAELCTLPPWFGAELPLPGSDAEDAATGAFA